MIKINENYLKLKSSYLFSEIAKRVASYQAANPGKEIIRMGIGDVTQALPKACIEAFHKAVDEMAKIETFRGYGPDYGYDFLRKAIAENDYANTAVPISADEIFVSDGAKCDTGNFQELFSNDIRVAIPDPVYPVYIDTNVMSGRAGSMKDGRYDNVTYLECSDANGFVPSLPKERVDLIYLCFPNNPTGATITREQLKPWVKYAKENRALILYDAAYEIFIQDPALPKTIYEIEGADEVAVEFRSFSKTAGFTGTRCAFTVVPKKCMGYTSDGSAHPLHALWSRRMSTKFNGVSYPVQRAAEAVYSPAGKNQVKEIIDHYMGNARIIRGKMTELGYKCIGGDNSPYIWVNVGMDSWQYFDRLLNEANVVCTPGEGFGRCGEGYVRISSFNTRSNVERAMERIALIKK